VRGVTAAAREHRCTRHGRCRAADERDPPAVRPHRINHALPDRLSRAATHDLARNPATDDVRRVSDCCFSLLVRDHTGIVLNGVGRNTPLWGLMPAPKRAITEDMNDNDITAREPSVDERFMGDWVAFGMSELQAYLTKHARFAAFCDELETTEDDLAA
jgi:hypothetical protein